MLEHGSRSAQCNFFADHAAYVCCYHANHCGCSLAWCISDTIPSVADNEAVDLCCINRMAGAVSNAELYIQVESASMTRSGWAQRTMKRDTVHVQQTQKLSDCAHDRWSGKLEIHAVSKHAAGCKTDAAPCMTPHDFSCHFVRCHAEPDMWPRQVRGATYCLPGNPQYACMHTMHALCTAFTRH